MAMEVGKKYQAFMLAGISALFGVALVVSFARSAWIGLIVGLIALAVCKLRKLENALQIQSGMLVVGATMMMIVIVGYSQLGHVLARTTQSTARLEVKSIDERKQSLIDGWKTFTDHPVIGTGVNGELKFMSVHDGPKYVPIEPPHAVPMIALLDFGIIGFVALAYLAWLGRRVWMSPILLCLIPGMLLDHFLWSYWSGLTLLGLAMILGHLWQQKPLTE
jgi:hypothetical protein